MTGDREFDVVLFGATGFVGELTAAHLGVSAPGSARVALAGRSASKLAAVKARLGVDWELIVADSSDEAAMQSLAARTSVVATTVGPYARYGLPLLSACAAAGTHYADLTGELLFVREAIDGFHEVARDTGAHIVNSCGFDSIPSDLGVAAIFAAAREADAGELTETTLVVTGLKGGASGGTIASITNQVTEMKKSSEVRRLVADPYALSPDREAEPSVGRQSDVRGVGFHDDLGGWTAPFVMAGFNTRVVRRSNALLGHAYGRTFRYSEVMGFGTGPAGFAKAAAVTGGIGVGLAGVALAPAALLRRVLPAPGTGPSEQARAKGYFDIEIHATTTRGRRFIATVAALGDPGYAATAVMFGESALALAFDELPATAGVVTPAVGIGEPLADRLRSNGFTLTAREVLAT